jgi:uncharacterized repeat protein (TIGR03803 family)
MQTEISKVSKYVLGLMLAATARANAQSYAIFHDFAGGPADGRFPVGALLEARDGALYGTAVAGGTDESGIVFTMNQDGTVYRVLRYFVGGTGDGKGPNGTLIEGSDGALYGTTVFGGSNNRGTVFTLNKDGSGYSTLVNFGSTGSDGVSPYAGLLEGSDGALYGTAFGGGQNGAGTVFTLNKDGTGYAVLKNFGEFGGDGVQPYGSVIEASDRALYGTTYWGGLNGLGAVYTMNKDGTGYAVLLSFGGESFDGTNPYSAVMEGSDGALYGTTVTGDEVNGSVYKVNKDGTGYEVIKRFTGFDGSTPYAAVAEGSDGALYGTTVLGGPGGGTVYKLNKDGTESFILHGFAAFAGDGLQPNSAVVFGSDGALYGTTVWGSSSGNGAAFRLSLD